MSPTITRDTLEIWAKQKQKQKIPVNISFNWAIISENLNPDNDDWKETLQGLICDLNVLEFYWYPDPG